MRVAAADAPAYRAAVGSIDRLSAPGEHILVAPQLSSLYVLTGRRPALRQISLLPGALDGAGERRAIAELGSAHVRLVVTDRHEFTEYGHGSFGSSFDRVLGTWIGKHFVRVGSYPAQAHTLDIWRRR
jgi:hypothetical protein